MTRITRNLHEDRFTIMMISRWILFRMGNLSDKRCTENQNTNFMFNNFFRKLCLLWDNVERYCVARQVTEKIKYGELALHAGYFRLQAHTQNM